MNARSLLADARLVDLEILCANNGVDALCVTETWLSEARVKIGSSRLHIPGFQDPVRCDRPSSHRGGGVAVYVRTGISANMIKLHSILEAVCVCQASPGLA